MSFVLDLAVDGLTEEQGRAVERRCRETGAWPVVFKPVRGLARAFRRDRAARLDLPEELDDGTQLLSDDADWDAPAWDLDPAMRSLLAKSVRILGEELPQGFTFRATWTGSEVRHRRAMSAEALAASIEASELNQFTLYRVSPRTDDAR